MFRSLVAFSPMSLPYTLYPSLGVSTPRLRLLHVVDGVRGL